MNSKYEYIFDRRRTRPFMDHFIHKKMKMYIHFIFCKQLPKVGIVHRATTSSSSLLHHLRHQAGDRLCGLLIFLLCSSQFSSQPPVLAQHASSLLISVPILSPNPKKKTEDVFLVPTCCVSVVRFVRGFCRFG